MRRFLFALFFIVPMCTFAQRQNDVWFFGEYGGISFSTGAPTPLIGPISTQEGTASVCDPTTGALLFTTDGRRVYDRNLVIMPNGDSLEGGRSSTQSALIIPKPRSPGFYYVFTAGDLSNGNPTNPGLHYNIVDMWQNGSNGAITWKNARLLDSCAEKLHATAHCDGESYWVVAHHITLPRFYMFKVTAAGIETPITIDVGLQYITNSAAVGGNYGMGMLKFSASGRQLAMANPFAKKCEVFDVDLFTGEISNPRLVDTGRTYYGLSFSPNEQLLYVTTWNQVFQYDLSVSPISAFGITLGAIPSADVQNYRGGIQRGPDGRIYVADGSRLQVIPYPDQRGMTCGYASVSAIALTSPTQTLIGLSNIIDGQYLTTAIAQCKPPVANFGCNATICAPECLSIVNYSVVNVDRWIWQFPGGNPSTFEGRKPPPVCFSTTGSSVIRLIALNAFGVDTMEFTVQISESPRVHAGADLTYCSAVPTSLNASGGVRYQWEPASAVSDATIADPIITSTRSTTFIVTGWNANGCSNVDTVVAEFLEPAPLIVNNVMCNVSEIAAFVIQRIPGDFDSCDISLRYGEACLSNISVDIGEDLGRGSMPDGRHFIRMRLRNRTVDNIIGRVVGTALLNPLGLDNLECYVESSYGCREVSGALATLETTGCALNLRHVKLNANAMLSRTIFDASGRVAASDYIRYDDWQEHTIMPSTAPVGLYIEVLTLEGSVVHRRPFMHGFH